jgi:hypothetical protein
VNASHAAAMTNDAAMRRIDALLSHVWVVRTFLKHSEEAEEDPELYEVVRELYDACLAVGPAWTQQDAGAYLKVVRKKIGRLHRAAEQFTQLQPRVSVHTNFKMAVASLHTAIADIDQVLASQLAPDSPR